MGLLNITLFNDNIVEETETFNLVINASSLPERVFAGDPNNTVVNILDSDGKKIIFNVLKLLPLILVVAIVAFNQTIYNVTENTGVVQITLFLSNILLTDVSVNISNVDVNSTGNFLLYIFSVQ